MGGTPLMAVAILGWPVSMLSPELAAEVIMGAQEICREAGIPLAGGHSIDAPEPMFGLAVTGRVAIDHLRKNGGAQPGDHILLTKPIGLGILTTAQKMSRLTEEDARRAVEVMTALNKPGEALGRLEGVHAMTDVTGFGLAGHLLEMCKASGIGADIRFDAIPLISDNLPDYIANQCSPAGAERTYQNLKDHLVLADPAQRFILCDPQTSGGLLIAVAPESLSAVQELLRAGDWHAEPIGRFTDSDGVIITVQ
jgi:selenide,water dikinase